MVYASTNDEFNPERAEEKTGMTGAFTVTSSGSVGYANQDFHLNATANVGYGFKQWRQVDSDGNDFSPVKIVGTTRKSKVTQKLSPTASNNVYYYQADFDETTLSVSSETPDKCQVFISKEINSPNDIVTLTASTVSNCDITWKKDGNVVSTDNPLVVTVTEKAHYTARATLKNTSVAEGFYRIRSANPAPDYKNNRVKLVNNEFDMTSMCGSITSVQQDRPGRINNAKNVLKKDLNLSNDVITDPSSVVYIKRNGTSGNEYYLYGQGTHVKEITQGKHHGRIVIPYNGTNLFIVKAGEFKGTNEEAKPLYSIYADINVSYSGYTIDLGKLYFNNEVSNGKHIFSIDQADDDCNSKWFLEPIDPESEDNYYAADFSKAIQANSKYYTTLRLPFNCQIPSGSKVKAYSITGYPASGDLTSLATAGTIYSAGSTIPAGLPVVIESSSNNPKENKLIPTSDPSNYISSKVASNGTTTSINTALYNYYGKHKHDDQGDQPESGDAVGYFSVAYSGSTTLYKLGVNENGVVGFWTAVTNGETIYGNQAYATQQCALFPKEIDLVDFPATQDEIIYKLVDPLTVAYVDNENNVIYAKDDNGAAEQAPAEGEEDFMKLHYGDNTYVGHSNWVAIEATSAPELQPAASRIEATGKVAEAMPNRRLKATKVVEIDREGDFDPNTYCLVNFMPKSSHSTTHHNFFFAEPQANEIARIIWAQWDGNNTFIVPPGSGFTGAVNVDFRLYNDSNNPTSKLEKGHEYQFIGLVKKVSAKEASNLYQLYPLSGITDHDDIITGVHNILTQNEVVSQKYYNTMGIESDVPFRGVNIMVTTYSDGSRVVTKVMR